MKGYKIIITKVKNIVKSKMEKENNKDKSDINRLSLGKESLNKKESRNKVIKRSVEFKNSSLDKLSTSSKNDILQKNKKNKNVINLNDKELNSLDYEKALLYDKRNYLQYYLSLLKSKHLIFFSFYPSNDYNSNIIKISLFFFAFSLFFVVNALFFSDSTMHKIYEEYEEGGDYSFINQIPIILYSNIISTILDKVVKYLSLTEKDILSLKSQKSNNILYKYIKLVRCLIIKFILYFFLSLIILFHFWCYLSCFCAVYKNTQIILFKDTLLSFGLSLLYPLGINLLPGLLRIPSLKSPQKNKILAFKISKILQLI